MRLLHWLAVVAAFALSAPLPAVAASLKSLSVREVAQLPPARPGYPMPSEPHQLFYLQRTTNSNTVIYAARFDANGNLDPRNPISVYWRRYATTRERMALRRIERLFGFGVNVSPGDAPGTFVVRPRPVKGATLQLYQTGPGRAEMRAVIGGRVARLDYVYLDVDEAGMLPAVTRVTVYGTAIASGRGIVETFDVTGGVLRP